MLNSEIEIVTKNYRSMSKLLEGCYEASDSFYRIFKDIDGKCEASDAAGNEYPMKIEYGDFGEADSVVQERSGGKHYNVKLTISFFGADLVDLGVVFDEGRQCSMKGIAGVSGLVKITEEDLERIRNDFDPIEAPPGPYIVQPKKKGKIVWLTGAPGMGKSTSAQLLARNHGYVYYEADCFNSFKNPYIPLDVANPSFAQMYQKVLKGPGMEERQSVVKKCQNVWRDLMAGNDYDKELMMEFYRHMAGDIVSEKRRIGGNFAIAHCLFTAEVRAAVRKCLGADLVIILLTMSSADRRERVLARHGDDVDAADLMDHFENLMEGVQEHEPNTIELKVDSTMTKDEVVTKIFEKIEKLSS